MAFALKYYLHWIVAGEWGLEIYADFTGGLVLGLEWDPQGLAFTQEGNRRGKCASLEIGKRERHTQRERELRERERQRKRESQGGRGGAEGGGCAQSSPGFFPEFHSSDAQVLRK